MKNFSKFILALLIVLLAAYSWSDEANAPQKNINVSGNTYANTCLPKQLNKLKTAVEINRSNNTSSAKAWPLISVLLCAQASNLNIESVLSKLSSKISVEEPAATGGTEKPKLLPRSKKLAESLMAKGFAWDANVTSGKNTLRINYLADGTCGKSFQLKLISNAWLLVSSSEICD
jgi:hypothetical protein